MTLHNLSEAKSAPDPEIIEILEEALKHAKSGELTGIVFFGTHLGRDTVSCQAGENLVADILVAYQDWLFRRMWERNRTDKP